VRDALCALSSPVKSWAGHLQILQPAGRTRTLERF
jgi:hypothetical protein